MVTTVLTSANSKMSCSVYSKTNCHESVWKFLPISFNIWKHPTQGAVQIWLNSEGAGGIFLCGRTAVTGEFVDVLEAKGTSVLRLRQKHLRQSRFCLSRKTEARPLMGDLCAAWVSSKGEPLVLTLVERIVSEPHVVETRQTRMSMSKNRV
jgi:hypothetical protein